jgi:hypothetical protein
MTDSELQAALTQSKLFDLNQVWWSPKDFFFFCLRISFQKHMISMQFLDDFKRAILVLSFFRQYFAMQLTVDVQAHANVFPHHNFGPEPIDDQVNFEPSRPMQNGMFTLKGMGALFTSSQPALIFVSPSVQQNGSDGQQHIDC